MDTNAAPIEPVADRDVRHPAESGRARASQIYLVRHGETAWSLTGQHTGNTDIPLTRHGEEQARDLTSVLSIIEFDHVLTSPALRARRTCELAGFGEMAAECADLAEWDYGDYEGKRSSDVHKYRPHWNVYQDGCPGGESIRDVTLRADRVIASLRALSGSVLVFSHGQFGCSLAARWIGLPVAAAQHLQLDSASVSVLAFNPSHPGLAVLAHWNGIAGRNANQPKEIAAVTRSVLAERR
jgi:broad specificity phosphatase PhoE